MPIKHHSTETHLLSVRSWKSHESSTINVTCLTLLDLSAASYRSFHFSWTSFILVRHFFYCSISLGSNLNYQTVLSMPILKTLNFLYSNSFRPIWSSSRIRPCPRSRSALIHHSSISTIISSKPSPLYADDTQQSFSAWISLIHITHLENTIAYRLGRNVLNWMSSNFLSLNSYKTEFLILYLVYHNNSLNSIILPFIYLTISYTLTCWFCSQSWCHLW